MNENQKFEQIWGFRRNIDSSSDDSKSNSNVGKSQEKLKSIPDLVSPEINCASNTDDRHVQVEKKPKRTRNTPKTEKKNKREVKSKPKKEPCASSNIKKKGNNSRKKKSKFISQMSVFDDFRIFTESILDDLRVARETMFVKMRKEMDQLMKSKPSSSSKKQKGSKGSPVKKPNQKPRAKKPTKPKQKTELPASKGLDPPQEHVNNKNSNDPSSKNPILSDSCAKKPIFTNGPDQIVTSSYLTLPLVLSNDPSSKLDRGNYSGLQGEERFRSYGHNTSESSCVGNGYPVGVNHHQRFDNSNNFGIPSRVVQGYSHDGSLLGTRMVNGGGIRYPAGLSGHTIPNHLASSGFRSLYPN